MVFCCHAIVHFQYTFSSDQGSDSWLLLFFRAQAQSSRCEVPLGPASVLHPTSLFLPTLYLTRGPYFLSYTNFQISKVRRPLELHLIRQMLYWTRFRCLIWTSRSELTASPLCHKVIVLTKVFELRLQAKINYIRKGVSCMKIFTPSYATTTHKQGMLYICLRTS